MSYLRYSSLGTKLGERPACGAIFSDVGWWHICLYFHFIFQSLFNWYIKNSHRVHSMHAALSLMSARKQNKKKTYLKKRHLDGFFQWPHRPAGHQVSSLSQLWVTNLGVTEDGCLKCRCQGPAFAAISPLEGDPRSCLFCCLVGLHFGFLRWGLTMSLGWPWTQYVARVGPNSWWSSCPSLSNAGITEVHHHFWLRSGLSRLEKGCKARQTLAFKTRLLSTFGLHPVSATFPYTLVKSYWPSEKIIHCPSPLGSYPTIQMRKLRLSWVSTLAKGP